MAIEKPGGVAVYKQSQERYDGGGQVKYLVYKSPQPLRNGRSQLRTRVKRLYFPADATNIRVDKLGELRKRTGRTVTASRCTIAIA